MSSIFYLVNTVLTVCLYAIILRLWMQFIRVNFYNPCTQFIIKITQPIIGPLRKLLPSVGRIDTATCLVLYIFALIKVVFVMHNIFGEPIWNTISLFYAFCAILYALGHLIFWLLLFRAILSWFSRGQSLVEDVLYQLTEPLVAPIRRIIPPIGNIDLSFMIVVFILIVLNIFAASLFSPLWLYL